MEVSTNESLSSVHSLKFMNDEIITISEYGKAIHDYSGRAEDELTFEEEDVIFLSLKDETGDWFFGELNGSRGWFPSSNVRILSDRECANEGLPWPPQSSLLNSASSFSIKSSYKDSSLFSIRNRCNSKDSFSSVSSSINHVTVPTNNEDASNPTIPAPQVRSWFSKYQQIKRYQPKRGPGAYSPTKLGSSALSNPPIAASNLSEKNEISESERKAALANSILGSSENVSNSNTNISLSNTSLKQNNPQSPIENKVKSNSDVNNNSNSINNNNSNNNNNDNNDNGNNDSNNNSDNNNSNNENTKDVEKKLDINKEDSDDDTYNEKFINEVANILNSDTNKYISLDDKVFKEENDTDNSNVHHSTGSVNDGVKRLDIQVNSNVSNSNSTNDIGSKPQTPTSANPRTNLSVNVNIDAKRGGHHSAKVGGSASTPTRIIQRVTTPTASRQKWSDFVSSSTMQTLSKKEIQRQEVMFEMINTEKDYLKDLNIVMDIYISPMKNQKILRQKDIDVIFSDWENILLVHNEITKRLEDRQKQGYLINEIGDIWIQMSDYLKVYTMYCSNHPFALVKLQSLSRNKNFTKFLESRLQLPESRNLNLANFLLKPVQRICKYPLLLREIIKNTEEDHPDYKNLVSALYKIETVITIINDAAKQTEGVHKLLELQQRFTTKVNIVANLRTIVHKSEIDIIEKRLNSYDKKRRQMYLLNDMVLIARSSTTGPESLNSGKLKLMAMISTKEILVKDLEDNQYIKNSFELVHTGKQSYRIAVDTPMNKDVWLKMLNNVILNDVQQSNKVDNVTSMKPSVETTYKSLNGKKNLKNLSPKTPDYRIATLKFGDASMIKEVEQEFNRINSQSYMSDTDDDKSIASNDDSPTSANVHSAIQEMPSICEDVVSTFDNVDTSSKTENKNINKPDDEDKKEKETTEEKSVEVKENNETSEKKHDDEEEEEEEEDEEKGSPLQTVTIDTDDDIFKMPVKRGSHSLDFEGIKDFYNNDDSNSSSTINARKRFSFPLSAIQTQNININDEVFKRRCDSSTIPEISDETQQTSSQIGLSESSIKEKVVEQDKMNSKENLNVKKYNRKEDESKNNDNNDGLMVTDDDKNIIVPLNEMLDDDKNKNINNNEEEEEEEEEEEDILPDNKFANLNKSYDSFENQSLSSKSESKTVVDNDNKGNESDNNLHNSSSSGSLVIKGEKDDEDSVSNSVDTLTMHDKNADACEEDFSFSKLRNMFGGISNKTCVSDFSLNVKNSEENNAKREELKNVILPAKIHHTNNENRRGLMINTIIDDNKSSQVDSPTRLIYDISKNPFIIKDMSSHKTKSVNPKTPDNDYKKNQPRSTSLSNSPSISGGKVSSIRKEFFSKDDEINKKRNNDVIGHSTTNSNSIDKKKEYKSEAIIKSPLTKEIQFNECDSVKPKEPTKISSVKTVKFGSTTAIDTGSSSSSLSNASVCVNNNNNKKVNFGGKSIISPKSSSFSNPSSSAFNSKSVSSSSLIKDVSSSTSSLNKTNKICTGSSNINKPVNNAKIVDVENVCIDSTKKYVYIIEVDRGLSDISVVHHTYDDFFDLHLQLIGNFPEEAGVSLSFSSKNNVTRRIIPDLPAQMMFVSEATARNRISGLQEYINTILQLPGKISRHPLVMNFFKTDGKWSAPVYSKK